MTSLECGGSGDDLPASIASAPPVPYEQYCEHYAIIACEAVNQCGCLDSIPGAASYCPTFAKKECEDDVHPGVESGAMRYDEAAGGRCLAAIHLIVSDCSLDNDAHLYLEACDKILIGQRAAGEECEDDDECQEGLECWSDKCLVPPTENQPCYKDYGCAEEFYCGSDKLCHTYHKSGQSCADGSSVCDEDLYCDTRDYTCQSYLTSGKSCSHESAVCDDDLYCSKTTKTCRPYPGPGESCEDSGGDCSEQAYCDETKTCRARQPVGAACSEDEHCLSDECDDNRCVDDDDLCSEIF